ncbi:MAG: hypothetical protein H6Q15_2093 [Bacteroidetes bacterium]|nr:hypothetical protein [Bacteroidota bacterium]
MERIINKITEVLESNKSKFIAKGVDPIQIIDIYKGQPQNLKENECTFPAVYIDYSIDYDQGLAYIIIHALYNDDYETENFSPQRAEGMKYITFLKVIKDCLKGIKLPPVFGVLKLSQDIPIESDEGNYHQITFKCTYIEELNDENRYLDVEIDGEINKGEIKG